MSDSKCPACGAAWVSMINGAMGFLCGSEQPIIVSGPNAGIPSPFGDLRQSDLCRIRQRDALLADVFALIERKRHNGECTCGFCQTLAALHARYKEMQK